MVPRAQTKNDKTSMLAEQVRRLSESLPQPVRIMEVCGTHTVAISRHGLRSLLSAKVKLISGPGCPVCVTGMGYIDALIELLGKRNVTVATYGDMVRVPGSGSSLEHLRAEGADVRVVLSARDALQLAVDKPDREVVFAAVGFETTTPATADVVLQANRRGLKNFSVLCSHKLVVPAMTALLEAGESRIDGFLCPGHVSVIIGSQAYQALVDRFGRPCVVAGFEPSQILLGLKRLLELLQADEAGLDNVYTAAVGPQPQPVAEKLIAQVFEVCDDFWRGLGWIADSGLRLKDDYRAFDAQRRFGLEVSGMKSRRPAGAAR